MAKVDYTTLDYDTLIGRKHRQCGKCKKKMAVTTLCPMRAKSENQYVCWHCCHKCGYAVDTPQGKACGIKLNRRKRELEQQQAARNNRKTKKQNRVEADEGMLNMEL